MLALTEVAGLLGKQYLPVLPPWGTGLALGPLRRLGVPVPPEMLGQLRFGRGLDNRKLKATGFVYRYTTRETVQAFAEYLRLQPILRGMREPYRYEREVEEFLRWSPHVRNPNFRKESRMSPDELVELQKLLIDLRRPVGGRRAERRRRARRPGRGRRARRARAGRRRRARTDEPTSTADAARRRRTDTAPARRSSTTTTWRRTRSCRCSTRSRTTTSGRCATTRAGPTPARACSRRSTRWWPAAPAARRLTRAPVSPPTRR